MRIWRLRRWLGPCVWIAAGLIAAVLLPTSSAMAQSPEAGAGASEPPGVDFGEWTPSVAAGFALFSQETTGSVFGDFTVLAAPGFVSVGELNNGDSLDGPTIPFSLELMAPAIESLPASPRAFGEAGFQWPREPRFLAARDQFQNQAGTLLPLMQLFVRMEKMWWAGLGMAFQLEVGGYPVRLRPSFNYFGQEADFQMRVLERVQIMGQIRQTEGRRFITEVYHGFGPKLGAEVEVGRRGPLAFGLQAAAYLAFFPGNLGFQVTGLSQKTRDPRGTFGGAPDTFRFEFDSLQIGGSLTFKVSWVGYAP